MDAKLKPPFPIFMVDDEESVLQGLTIALKYNGFSNLISCSDSREVGNILKSQHIELMLLDLTMPHISGEEILKMVSEEYPHIIVIIITGNKDIDTAVRCLKLHAYDYLVKPIEMNRLITTVSRALELAGLRTENRILSGGYETGLKNIEAFRDIAASSPAMLKLMQYTEAVATSPQPVLITGETGTGKELFARAIHKCGGFTGEFIAVNIAGVDDHMASDTLFGHRKGAFTGADENRKGLIENARNGVLFLDEIADISPAMQIKLLRLIQEREYAPLGADESSRTNAKIVAATNVPPEILQSQKKIRSDLYFRLQTHVVRIPRLAERKEDLPLLVDTLIEQCSREMNRKKPTCPPELIQLLANYDFPGNVRELKTMIYDALAAHKDRMLSMKTFKDYIFGKMKQQTKHIIASAEIGAGNIFAHLDKLPNVDLMNSMLAAEALKRAQGNKSTAAKMLGISRSTFNTYLDKGQNSGAD